MKIIELFVIMKVANFASGAPNFWVPFLMS